MARKEFERRVIGVVTKSYRYLGDHNRGERVTIPLSQVAQHVERGVKVVTEAFDEHELREYCACGGNLDGFLKEKNLWLDKPVVARDAGKLATQDPEKVKAAKADKVKAKGKGDDAPPSLV